MKALFIYIFISIAIASCVGKEKSPPKLDVKNHLLELGTINFDSTYQLEYIVRNSGDIDLIIDTITSSCGCSTPHLSKQIISANDTALVKVTYKPVEKGIFDKSLVIKSNSDSIFSVLRFRGETL
jgi:Protein of unknown function (DUF1573)